MQRVRLGALFATALFIAGCGGGGSGSAVAPARPGAVPTTVATSVPSQAPAQPQQVAFRIPIPQAAPNAQSRQPKYISAGTQSASVTVATVGGTPSTPVVVNCTTVCQGTIASPVGSDTF